MDPSNHDTAECIVLQHSDDKECELLWRAALKHLDYKMVWNTPHMDMPPKDEPVLREWLCTKEHRLSMIPK